MKRFLLVLAIAAFSLGCARVSVQGTKEPIKVDIAMRLDIYQHVEKDIDAIENIVSGSQEKSKPADDQSFLEFFVNTAYAQESLSPEVEQAALRRKDRVNELRTLEAQGAIGENKSGMVEARNSSGDSQLIAAENSDRMTIYKSLAAKNGTSVDEVGRLYAKRLQSDAPAGTPIEIPNGTTGAYEWKIK
ncbi:MAG TPA: DUF1318 domain-containing protein [Candidatus Omnitrophota bacterium]|nr:DUF1318 domain-containing protein [Candidatus Omnitrophota bacterium]HPD84823.1 DUF1318 domain-containing protein [Candidatus Omnitrophota bacterium]HRZ03681.1 DUF1318 domain-containing protein [Candidatus Omnitrophota bacterium]